MSILGPVRRESERTRNIIKPLTNTVKSLSSHSSSRASTVQVFDLTKQS